MGEVEKRERCEKLTGAHVLWASTMSAVFDFGIGPVVLPVMRIVALKVILFQMMKKIFPSTKGKQLDKELFRSIFEQLNEFINFANGFEIDFLPKENGNGRIILKIKKDSCMYCPKGVGGEQLGLAVCPYPLFLSTYLDFILKNGGFYKSVKTIKETDGSYMHSEGEWDIIPFDVDNDDNFKEICNILHKSVERIENIMSNALKEGKISEEELWDRNYVELPNTNPKKYRTKFTDFIKSHIQPVEDSILLENKQLTYAALSDDNGYIGVPNSEYDKPLTGDHKTDLIYSLSMRIFDDYVGISVAKNTDPILLLPYFKVTGSFIYLVSSPVYVNNKHWGALAIGFKI